MWCQQTRRQQCQYVYVYPGQCYQPQPIYYPQQAYQQPYNRSGELDIATNNTAGADNNIYVHDNVIYSDGKIKIAVQNHAGRVNRIRVEHNVVRPCPRY